MVLRTHWVLVVMDHYTRRIIGFGIHAGVVNGEALCRMFKQAIRGVTTFPRYLSFPGEFLISAKCLGFCGNTMGHARFAHSHPCAPQKRPKH
jgi:hypothetical protein